MTFLPYDDLGAADYRAMYDALRNPPDPARRLNLRQIEAELSPFGSGWSIAAWSKYERGLLDLNVTERNAIRRYYGLQDVPRPPADIVADAGITAVIEASPEPDLAVLVGPETLSINLGQNGVKRPVGAPLKVQVTSVTAPRKRPKRKGYTTSHKLGERLAERKFALGLTWEQYFERLYSLDLEAQL